MATKSLALIPEERENNTLSLCLLSKKKKKQQFFGDKKKMEKLSFGEQERTIGLVTAEEFRKAREAADSLEAAETKQREDKEVRKKRAARLLPLQGHHFAIIFLQSHVKRFRILTEIFRDRFGVDGLP